MNMGVVRSAFALCLFAGISSRVAARVCYPGQEPDPTPHGPKFLWYLTGDNPARCTEFRPGGLNTRRHAKLHWVTIGSDRDLPDLEPTTTEEVQHGETCSFVTEGRLPYTFTFILGPLGPPFRLRWEVKTDHDAIIGIAEQNRDESVFVDIAIGGGGNTRSMVRACYNEYNCAPGNVAVHMEAGIVNDRESRPFWIEYKGGVVKVGKGGQEEAFLEWDAGAHHGRVFTEVYIGIASWGNANADWVFYDFC